MQYLFSLIFFIAFSFIYKVLAFRYNIIDTPNHRSSHKIATIRGGGILFPLAIIIFFILHDYQYPYFTLGVLLIAVVSFLDDIYTLPSKIRFPFHLLAVVLTLYQVSLPLSPFYLVLLFLFLGVGTINMFNFMDGVNGITGLYSLTVLLGLFSINNLENIVHQDLFLFVGLALLVFGFYNFRKKALFFAGDIGSVTIGLLLFFIGLSLTLVVKSPLVLLFIVIYGADATLTLLYRKLLTNESVLKPHRHHIYQKLVDIKKIGHLKVSFYYAIAQLLINIVIFYTYQLELFHQYMVFMAVISICALLYLFLFKKLKV